MTHADRRADPAGAAAPARSVAVTLAGQLAESAGGFVRAVVLYGSHLHGARPDRHSALDFVVVVSSYRGFYEALHAAGEIHRAPWMMSALSHLLTPNVTSFAPDGGAEGLAKCLVITAEDLARGLGPRPPDHFLLARMVQKVVIVWSADSEARQAVEAAIDRGLSGVLDWAGPHLEGTFDAEELGRTLLAVSYRGELRPEATNRAEVIFETQREHFRSKLRRVLQEAATAGTVVADGEAYRLAERVPLRTRWWWRLYFLRSKARVTARWLKHVVTFDNWLPYVTRKVERRTGMKVELTRLERRWPLVFLWPRVVRVFLSRPEREGQS